MRETTTIPYADSVKSFEVDDANLLESHFPTVPEGLSADQEQAILRQALDHPVGTPQLSDLARSARTVALLADDWTRPTPAYKVAPIVIAMLLDSGIHPGDTRIIFARGTLQTLTRD